MAHVERWTSKLDFRQKVQRFFSPRKKMTEEEYTQFLSEAAPLTNEISMPLYEHVPLKGNSFNIIFACFSTMMGSTLLVIPKGFRDAGPLFAAFLSIFVGGYNAYTTNLLVEMGSMFELSFSSLLLFFGPWAERVVLSMSVLIILGALMLYHFYIVDGVEKLMPDKLASKIHIYIAVGVGVAQFFIGLLKKIKPLFRLASYAFVVPLFCIVFILIVSIREIIHSECTLDPARSIENGGQRNVWDISATGMIHIATTLHLSLFLHSVVFGLVKEATHPERNLRDVNISYFLAWMTFALAGTLPGIAFQRCKFTGDFLEMFSGIFADFTRAAVIVLVAIIYPVILFVARAQLLSLIFGEGKWPYWSHIVTTIIFLIITTTPCAMSAEVEFVASIIGTLAVVFVSFVPLVMYIQFVRRRLPDRATVLFYLGHGFLLLYGAALTIVAVISFAAPGLLPATKH